MASVVIADADSKSDTDGLVFRNVRINRYGFDAIGDSMLFLTILREIIRWRPEVVHLFHLKPYLYGGLAAQIARLAGWRGRLIATVPGRGRLYAGDTSRSGMRKLRRRIVQPMLRIALKDADVTFETKADRDFWVDERLTSALKAHVVNGAGIDMNAFSPARRQRRDGQRLRVLYAGRLLVTKGLDTFLQAAQMVQRHARGAQIEMMIAGSHTGDPDEVPLADLVDAPGVRLLGHVDDMPKLLSECDVVVLPSRYNEGIPRILIEAAATGCVPVATHFAGSEAVIRHGKTGFLLAEGSMQEQAAEVSDLLAMLEGDRRKCSVIGDQAAGFVREGGFDNRSVNDALLSLYAFVGQRN